MAFKFRREGASIMIIARAKVLCNFEERFKKDRLVKDLSKVHVYVGLVISTADGILKSRYFVIQTHFH